MTLRVGLIGAGVMGGDHARTLSRHVAGATVAAVTDIDPSRADQLAAELGATPLASAEDLIAAQDVDAVIIASHDAAHATQVLACIEAGKPVLCEKPLAPTSAECERIIDAQRRRGLGALVSVGFMRRFHPSFTAMKLQVDARSLGEPVLVLGSHRNVSSYPTGGSDGTLSNSAVHDIDTAAWLLGSVVVEVEWFAARQSALVTDRQDPQLIHLRSANGVLASIDLFLNAQYGYDVRYEVVCERGNLRLRPPALVDTDRDGVSGHSLHPDWRGFFADAYRLELTSWVERVTQGRPSELATAEDGLRSTLVAEALIQSRQEGKPVRVRRSTVDEGQPSLMPNAVVEQPERWSHT
ncbi:Gfo/Idh/MocA family protein [Terrabacter terrigena]|uniref:Gfo/Idh/MocA family protein n=1 Tax=Terrabacter terrigena TaxID=574718 RepID=A0ABW3N5S8_9MICO